MPKHLRTILTFVTINAVVTFMVFKESFTNALVANIITAVIVLIIFHKD